MMLLVFVCSTTSAEVYKCDVNGKQVFSDRPCATNAEKVEIKVYQPKAEDIDKQHRETQRYTEDSQYDEIDALRAKNKALKAKINQLIRQRNTKMERLNEQLYEYSDTMVATSDPDLFKKIDALNAEYLRKINQVEIEIQQNETRMSKMKFLIDSKH